ncbi:zinc-binding alcohol dehydrogenase family protein [Occallatibacter savannae]|uniref:zinc-binding alcohol dehydrogenase family protein n=1 Tax=Occallatibacter savannae TaxID=1002691 RepID=UPI000D6A029E|nr:zinc-binding alcohol dehydrogenase family protein [Occallatibacter savannae]
MKAIMLQAPGKAAVQEVAEAVRRDDEVLLQIRKIGLCGSDLNSYRGRNPLVSYPRIPGHEIAATVIDAGSNSDYPAGTNVTLSPYRGCGRCAACERGRPNACKDNETLGVQRDGALTEFISAPVAKLFRADLSLKELCLVEPLTVGFHAVGRGRVTAGDTVAVFGCGGVGLGAIAGAAFRGARVIGIDVDNAKLDTARKAGATDVINSKIGNLHDQLSDLTNGRGPDVIIEAIGLPATYRAAVEEVAYAGRVVYIGWAKEQVAYETRPFVHKELDIMGSRNAMPDDFHEVIRMLEAKRFPVEAAVTHTIAFDETPEILESWNHKPERFTKIMVDVS